MSTKVVACATVIEEILPLLSPTISCEVLDFGLHSNPENLRLMLQQAIDAVGEEIETLVLGYGLCSMAVVGLKATTCRLVVPRVDDCIAIFLGSTRAYQQQARQEPGTYYLTKGWIKAADTPFEEYDRLVERYGLERADRMMGLLLKNYTRLAFIDTGQHRQEHYRAYARLTAGRFNLRYEEIPGSTALVRKMLYGPWDEDFIVVRPGETLRYTDFKNAVPRPCNAPAGNAEAADG